MNKRWMVSVVTALLIYTAVDGQNYPGYFTDREGNRKNAVFIVPPALFSRQPDFGAIATGIYCLDNRRKVKLMPGMCQSIHLQNGNEQIEFLSLTNLAGKEVYNADSIFLRPRIIGYATLYYFYYFSRSPVVNINRDGTVCARKQGPLRRTKQGWIIARDDGTVLKMTGKVRNNELLNFFGEYEHLAGIIRNNKARANCGSIETFVSEFNRWKKESETLNAINISRE